MVSLIRSNLKTFVDFDFELFHITEIGQYISHPDSNDVYLVDHKMKNSGKLCYQLLNHGKLIILLSQESRLEEQRELIDLGVEEILIKEEFSENRLFRKIIYALHRNVLEQKRTKQLEVSIRQADAYHSRLLGSNMNPHFIFNILNSLQYYILESKKEDALSFLARFSKLIRLALDNSRQEVISLEEEIEFLQQYIEIQKERYGFLFHLNFRIKSEFHPEEYAIPPLLLQPFVENAIMHGLDKKLGEESVLELEIELEVDRIVYRIVDTGPGFTNTDQTCPQERKSHALEITRERIDLLNRQGYQSFALIIENRKGKRGTLVQLNSPLIKF